ncbi:MAG: hypothetical protein ACREQQ_13650 [Candidatus Binatia bacterium]
MADGELIGVYREARFSPGKVEDDRAIIDLVAAVLRRRGFAVRMVDGDSPPRLEVPPSLIFAMCQSAPALAWLDAFAERSPVVNHPRAIRNCYRTRMVDCLERARVSQPRWQRAGVDLPAELGPGPWLKRGDVHAMEAGDVRRIFASGEWSEGVASFGRRGIREAIAQEHVEGKVYKFYGVTGGFFRSFGEAPLDPRREEEAARLAARAARALGLEVYGGDAVFQPNGSPVLIDFNDWPSFSRCRGDAAAAIGARLVEILEKTIDDGSETRPVSSPRS